MGFSSTLDDALSQSVEHAINMITAMFEMPRQDFLFRMKSLKSS
ncbi:hypothetical protein [Bifidobacterium pseudocatenulatum]|nr:hypothetical protein [Bifidobacterium pseudocatenulatum]